MTLTSVPYLFCLITRGPASAPVFASGTPGYVVCFTSDRDASEFMAIHGEADWNCLWAYRGDVPALAAELRRAGALGLLFDPRGAADRVSLVEDKCRGRLPV